MGPGTRAVTSDAHSHATPPAAPGAAGALPAGPSTPRPAAARLGLPAGSRSRDAGPHPPAGAAAREPPASTPEPAARSSRSFRRLPVPVSSRGPRCPRRTHAALPAAVLCWVPGASSPLGPCLLLVVWGRCSEQGAGSLAGLLGRVWTGVPGMTRSGSETPAPVLPRASSGAGEPDLVRSGPGPG